MATTSVQQYLADIRADYADLEERNPTAVALGGATLHMVSVGHTLSDENARGYTYLVTGLDKYRRESASALSAFAVMKAVYNAQRVWRVYDSGKRERVV